MDIYEEVSLGPWGGEDGVYWAYMPDGPIMQITVHYGPVIESIAFESKRSDGDVLGGSKTIGNNGGNMTKTFCIDSSVEQVSSIILTYGEFNKQVTLHSFLVNTNLNEYGPFGLGIGASFVTIPIAGGVLAGFHGRLGNHISAFGVFLIPKVSLPNSKKNIGSLHLIQDPGCAPSQPKGKNSGEEGWISLGPWGGKDGVDWVYKPDVPIMQISIRYGQVIESIAFNGVVIGGSEKIGNNGGDTTKTFCIDSSVEKVSSIILTYGRFNEQVAIHSILLNTDLNEYGPFGLRSGVASVSIPIGGGILTGFHGRLGNHITAIGVFVAPKVISLPSSVKKVDGLHSIQDPDSAPSQLKREGDCGYFVWVDPPMCARSKVVIPGLLRSIGRHEVEKKMLKKKNSRLVVALAASWCLFFCLVLCLLVY